MLQLTQLSEENLRCRRVQFCDLNQPDQLKMTPNGELKKYRIYTLHVVKYMFKNVNSCKHNMREKYAF